MNHFKKIAAALEAHQLDAVLLTCEANRFYASGFHSSGTDGIALVTRNRNYYFTDSRYTEAAGRHVQGAQIREANREHPYSALINAVIETEHIARMGYEDEYLTAAAYRRYAEKLHCELVPATELLWDLRAVKDPEELDCMIRAQRITEQAFDDILKEIRPGVSEKEIAARILYLMLHYGAEDKSFDPIVVSGTYKGNTYRIKVECYPNTPAIKVQLLPVNAGERITMTQNLGQPLPRYQAFLCDGMLEVDSTAFMDYMEENDLGYIVDYKRYDADVFTGVNRRTAAVFQFHSAALRRLNKVGCQRYEGDYTRLKQKHAERRARRMAG